MTSTTQRNTPMGPSPKHKLFIFIFRPSTTSLIPRSAVDAALVAAQVRAVWECLAALLALVGTLARVVSVDINLSYSTE
jgi:hypothetical protein